MDETTIKLAGQVMGLEMVLKTMIALQLSSQVKDETGFPKAAQMARELRDRLSVQVHMMRDTPQAQKALSVSVPMYGAMQETVERCFDQTVDMMEQLADLVLQVSEPPTDAKN